ncbi:MAG TPA: hypothetical protein DCP28_29340, partial [Cytophagales bacterium]|nr:hypothetical protein [Cytophagales bacterium]
MDSVSSDTLAFTVPNVAPSAFSFTDPSPLSSINQNEFVTFRWGRAEDNATVNYTLRITGGTLDTLLATGTSRTARERLDWVQNVT